MDTTIYDNGDGTYSTSDGITFDSYDNAQYYVNQINGLGSSVGPAQVADPSASSNTSTILDTLTTPALSPTDTAQAGTNNDAWAFLGTLLQTTASTAGTILNQNLNTQVQLAGAKANSSLQTQLNKLYGVTAPKTTTSTFPWGTVLLIGVGVIAIGGFARASRRAA